MTDLVVLFPYTFKMSFMRVCRDMNPKLIFCGSNSLNASFTCWIRPSMVRAGSCRHCAACRARKNDKSSTFMSGDFGGCNLRLIFHRPVVAAATNSASSTLICASAPSCWMTMLQLRSGYLSLMAGITLFTTNS